MNQYAVAGTDFKSSPFSAVERRDGFLNPTAVAGTEFKSVPSSAPLVPPKMSEAVHHQLTIPFEHAGQRLDQVLADLLEGYSRTRIKEWIDAGQVG